MNRGNAPPEEPIGTVKLRRVCSRIGAGAGAAETALSGAALTAGAAEGRLSTLVAFMVMTERETAAGGSWSRDRAIG